MGASLDQLIDGEWKPLAFFSRKLSHAELKYSAFNRELLAIYLSTKHFRYFLEGRRFAIYMDHLPLTTAIASAADRSPRQARHLSYVAEFTTDLCHLPGKSNVVADALSRSCAELNAVLASPIDSGTWLRTNRPKPTPSTTRTKLTRAWCCGRSTSEASARGRPRPFVPAPWRKTAFDAIHGLAHLGKKPTLKAVSSEFVWPCMHRDITSLSSEQGWPTYSRPPASLCGAERPFRPSPCVHCRPPSTLSGLYLSLHRHRQIHPLD